MPSNHMFSDWGNREANGIRQCMMYFRVKLHHAINGETEFDVAYLSNDGKWMHLWKKKGDHTTHKNPDYKVTLGGPYTNIEKPAVNDFYGIFKYRARDHLTGFLDCDYRGEKYHRANLELVDGFMFVSFYDITGAVTHSVKITSVTCYNPRD